MGVAVELPMSSAGRDLARVTMTNGSNSSSSGTGSNGTSGSINSNGGIMHHNNGGGKGSAAGVTNGGVSGKGPRAMNGPPPPMGSIASASTNAPVEHVDLNREGGGGGKGIMMSPPPPAPNAATLTNGKDS